MKTLTVTCLAGGEAASFAAYLTDVEGIDRVSRDGADVSMPWAGDPRFAMDVFTLAVEGGYADDHAGAQQMARTLTALTEPGTDHERARRS